MTPQEKAKEIAENLYKTWGDSAYATGAEYGATEMHEWDKQQMKDALNNILIECDACFDEQTTNTLESIIKHQIEIL